MRPLVSIVIPNYNYGHYINKALDSAVNQSYKNIEVLVVDNCSTDNSVEIARMYENKYSNVQVIVNKENLGIVRNFNRGIELSRGKYIIELSSDDYLDSEFIENCVNVIEKYPQAGMVVTAMHTVDIDGKVEDISNYYSHSFICKGIEQCRIFLISNTFVPSQVLFKKECVQNKEVGGGFNEILDVAMDVELWFRICLHYDFIYLNKRLCYYRNYVGSVGKNYEDMRGVLQDYLLKYRYKQLIQGNKYLMQYIDDAMRRRPLYCVRCIKRMLYEKQYQTVKRYLSLLVAFDLDVIETEYYNVIIRCIEMKNVTDKQEYEDAEEKYISMLKRGYSKGGNVAPYPLPEGAKIIEDKKEV